MSFDAFDLLTADTDIAESIEWLKSHGFYPVVTMSHDVVWTRDVGEVIDSPITHNPSGLTLYASMDNYRKFSAWVRHNGAFRPRTANHKRVEEAFKELCQRYPLAEWIRENLPKEKLQNQG